MKLVNYTIERFKKQKLMNEKVAEGLKRNDPKTPKFYLRPKIHKEVNPGRPVVSSTVIPQMFQNMLITTFTYS